MCGIAGFLGKKTFSPKKDKIKKVLKIMKNRGPDSSGYYERELNEKSSLSLLHSRLSVIDPEKRSNQPFVDEHGVLIFNGMIYNFIEIRKKLKKKKLNLKQNQTPKFYLNF